MKMKFVRFLLYALITLLCIIGALVACGSIVSDDETETIEQTQSNQPQQQETQKHEEYVPAETIVFSGAGDDVIDIPLLDYFYVFHISGNKDAHHFSVKSYDSAGNYNELLVNTTDPYDGVTYDMAQNAVLLEISAVGEWTIELVDAATLKDVAAGSSISGSGDAVFLVSGGKTADIKGNANASHFAVKSFSGYGDYLDLLVNTTDPYEGKVMLKDAPRLIVVTADGDWSITVN